ncbi:hypothetical protein [Prevotella sp. AM34-19LB]|uniref:hypothetical protein n=1 Tax=Prevotella sp. AM34-19LB TaxID=2292364 RepID=UPI0018F2EA19|nr:hypothetical protein [Prevotella sp. AM34-19LB]
MKHHDVRACLAEFCHTPYCIGGSGGTSLALLWCVIRQFRGGQRELQTERGQRENTPLQEDGDRADAVLRHIHLRYARKQVGLVAHFHLQPLVQGSEGRGLRRFFVRIDDHRYRVVSGF